MLPNPQDRRIFSAAEAPFSSLLVRLGHEPKKAAEFGACQVGLERTGTAVTSRPLGRSPVRVGGCHQVRAECAEPRSCPKVRTLSLSIA